MKFLSQPYMPIHEHMHLEIMSLLPKPQYLVPAHERVKPLTILNTLLSLHIGGPQHQCLFMGEQLHNAPFEYIVCSEEIYSGWDTGLFSKYQQAGIPVLRVDHQSQADLHQITDTQKRLFHFVPANLGLRKLVVSLIDIIKWLQPDILCSWHPIIYPPMDAAIWAALLAGVPRIVLRFNSLSPAEWECAGLPQQPWLLEQFRFFASLPQVYMLANSHAGATHVAEWLALNPEKISVISNAISPNHYAFPSKQDIQLFRHQYNIPDDSPLVTGIFRLVGEKNILDFIEIMRILHSKLPALRIIHAGSGPLEKGFREALRTAGLESISTLLGGSFSVPLILSSAQAMLHTAVIEGLLGVWLEAMYYGCPLVVTDVGAAYDLIRNGSNGFIHKSGDLNGMADSLYNILTNNKLSDDLKHIAKRHIEHDFMIEASAEQARVYFKKVAKSYNI